MARLRVSTTIPAPIEDVYQHVTGYGADGVIDDEVFKTQFGEVLESDGDILMVQEDTRLHPDDPPDLVTWRYAFDYLSGRSMETSDSIWANRYDTFHPAGDGTKWTVTWVTKRKGPRSIVQFVFFKILGRRSIRRQVVEPVSRHFQR